MSKLDDARWKAKHIYKAHGQPAINLDGAIDLGHDDGLNVVDSTIVQLPTPENGHNAIVHVRVMTERGSFDAHGESSEQRDSDVNEKTGEISTKPPVAMAEARALTRALLLATNNGLALADPQRAEAPDPPATQPQAHTQTPATQPQDTQQPQDGTRPPTRSQLSVLAELATQLGEPIPAPLSYDDAGDLITRLGNDLRRTRANTRSA